MNRRGVLPRRRCALTIGNGSATDPPSLTAIRASFYPPPAATDHRHRQRQRQQQRQPWTAPRHYLHLGTRPWNGQKVLPRRQCALTASRLTEHGLINTLLPLSYGHHMSQTCWPYDHCPITSYATASGITRTATSRSETARDTMKVIRSVVSVFPSVCLCPLYLAGQRHDKNVGPTMQPQLLLQTV